MIPSHYDIVYDKRAIAEKVVQLGEQISPWSDEIQKKTGHDLLVIPLLRGGIYFCADLTRLISPSIDLCPIRASSYLGKAGNVEASEVKAELDGINVMGRGVLIVDDICDSGRTLGLLTKNIRAAGAADVRTAVLVKREIAGAFEPDWCGFRYAGDQWFVGYGMDDQDRWRNLPSIYVMRKSG